MLFRIAYVPVAMKVAEPGLHFEKLHKGTRRGMKEFCLSVRFSQLVPAPILSEGPLPQQLGMDKSKIPSFVPFKHI